MSSMLGDLFGTLLDSMVFKFSRGQSMIKMIHFHQDWFCLFLHVDHVKWEIDSLIGGDWNKNGDLMGFNGIYIYTILIGGLEPWNFEWLSRNTWEWNNHPNWRAYFSEGLKPPTSHDWTKKYEKVWKEIQPYKGDVQNNPFERRELHSHCKDSH